MPNEAPAGNPHIERLVAALNECPGIFVVSSYSSLAGASPAEEREGEFSVSFTVDPSTGGWRSFDLILSVCGEDANIVAWWAAEGQMPGAVAFQLEGRGETTPDRMADAIETVLRLWKQGT